MFSRTIAHVHKSSVEWRQFRCTDLWASYCRFPL